MQSPVRRVVGTGSDVGEARERGIAPHVRGGAEAEQASSEKVPEDVGEPPGAVQRELDAGAPGACALSVETAQPPRGTRAAVEVERVHDREPGQVSHGFPAETRPLPVDDAGNSFPPHQHVPEPQVSVHDGTRGELRSEPGVDRCQAGEVVRQPAVVAEPCQEA